MATKTLEAEMVNHINDLIDEELSVINLNLQKVLKDTYRQALVGNSPKLTGYYGTNHRVSIRSITGQFKAGSNSPALKPRSRPEPEVLGSLFGNFPFFLQTLP